MDLIIVGSIMAVVIALYFKNNPLNHSRKFMIRRFINWFPLGLTYAFLYMARYNLNVMKNAMGDQLTKADFGIIFGIGTAVYGFSFLIVGPLVDRIGGKKGMIICSLGAALCNIALGVATYMYLMGQVKFNLVVVFSGLYAVNMFFQSYGAVSIIKVKAYWFHVRERGGFGAIFGTLLSFGAYFALDWGPAIADATKINPDHPNWLSRTFNAIFAINTGTSDAIWFVFFVPAVIMIMWALIDMFILKDMPSQANFEDFDTHDASSDEMDKQFTVGQLLAKIFSNPLILTFAAIEFCSGILRNATLQWYYIYLHEVPEIAAKFFLNEWGILLALGGVVGGFVAGYASDYFFQSRRGPPAMFFMFMMFLMCVIMALTLGRQPFIVGCCAIGIWTLVIGVHSLMSGTAAADFGGRKATATASGILDGFVYLGSGVQSVCLGFLVTKNWLWLPVFMAPFALLAVYLAWRTWNALPEATKKYVAANSKPEVAAPIQRASLVLERE